MERDPIAFQRYLCFQLTKTERKFTLSMVFTPCATRQFSKRKQNHGFIRRQYVTCFVLLFCRQVEDVVEAAPPKTPASSRRGRKPKVVGHTFLFLSCITNPFTLALGSHPPLPCRMTNFVNLFSRVKPHERKSAAQCFGNHLVSLHTQNGSSPPPPAGSVWRA